MEAIIVKDSNGNLLNDGDSVILIKSLKVKGGGTTLKQGTLIKKIRLTDNEEEVDCKVDGMSIVLKACFLKKK
ncbi:MAG: PhnA protein [Mucilaginibacter sp.]|nr:PhnA protein [Mucilaginibacter sp.]